MKYALLAAAAVLAISTSAHAGLIGDTTNNYDITNNTPVANAGAQAGAAAGAVAGATGGNATGGSVGDIDVRGGSATSTLGSLNSFGGDGGSVLGSGNSANTNTNTNTNLLGQGQMQGQVAASDQTQGQSLTNTNSLSQGNSQSVGGQSANHSSANTSNVNIAGDEAQARNPVATAMAFGSAGVGAGLCRFGPGVGAQGIAAGASLSLPIFKDKDCVTIAKAELVFKTAGAEAAVQYLAARDAEINAAVTQARTVK